MDYGDNSKALYSVHTTGIDGRQFHLTAKHAQESPNDDYACGADHAKTLLSVMGVSQHPPLFTRVMLDIIQNSEPNDRQLLVSFFETIGGRLT